MAQTPSIEKLLLGGLYASIALTVLVAVMFSMSAKNPHKPTIFLGGQEVTIDIANTLASQEQGLSGREALGEGEGMLFIFPAPAMQGFWMKDMRFPIDIIYFDHDRKIIDVWEHADPSSYPSVFSPRAPAQFVLEVPAGFFAKNHLQNGNMFELVR